MRWMNSCYAYDWWTLVLIKQNNIHYSLVSLIPSTENTIWEYSLIWLVTCSKNPKLGLQETCLAPFWLAVHLYWVLSMRRTEFYAGTKWRQLFCCQSKHTWGDFMTLMGTLAMCEEFEEFLDERKNFILSWPWFTSLHTWCEMWIDNEN